jgi:hypothetical protein
MRRAAGDPLQGPTAHGQGARLALPVAALADLVVVPLRSPVQQTGSLRFAVIALRSPVQKTGSLRFLASIVAIRGKQVRVGIKTVPIMRGVKMDCEEGTTPRTDVLLMVM